MSNKPEELILDQFPSQTTEKLRFCDTDQLGHINNAVFAMMCEAGRTAIIYDPENPIADHDTPFAIVKLTINFLAEMNYPGEVTIGTGVTRVGGSSFNLLQGIYSNGECAATCESVLVQMDAETRRAAPLAEKTKAALEALMVVAD